MDDRLFCDFQQTPATLLPVVHQTLKEVGFWNMVPLPHKSICSSWSLDITSKKNKAICKISELKKNANKCRGFFFSFQKGQKAK